MTLTKNRMVAEIGLRTQLNNYDVQQVLETLLIVWQESLLAGERIELENFFVLEVQTVDRGFAAGELKFGTGKRPAPRLIRRLILRTSKQLKGQLNDAKMQ